MMKKILDLALGRKAPVHLSVENTTRIMYPESLKINDEPILVFKPAVSWGQGGWGLNALDRKVISHDEEIPEIGFPGLWNSQSIGRIDLHIVKGNG